MGEFQTRLRQAMFMKGIRQIDLAQRSGIDRSKICSYLKGRYKPNADAVTKLASALGVTSEWLMGGGEKITLTNGVLPAIPNEEEMELLEKYRKADETKKQIVRLALGMKGEGYESKTITLR